MVKKLTGWGTRGRPFSESEFKRSYIRVNTSVKKYPDYLKRVAKTLASKNIRDKRSLKAGMK